MPGSCHSTHTKPAWLGVGGGRSGYCLCEQYPDVDSDDEIAIRGFRGMFWLAGGLFILE